MGSPADAQVGSGAHRTAVAGHDDREEMGICLEPPQFVTGLCSAPAGITADDAIVVFEHDE